VFQLDRRVGTVGKSYKAAETPKVSTLAEDLYKARLAATTLLHCPLTGTCQTRPSVVVPTVWGKRS
jgi:hypothetical protein